MKKYLMASFLVFFFRVASAQVEMADQLRSSGKIYVVVGVIAVIFIGLAVYLITIDRKISKVEREPEDHPIDQSPNQ